MTSIVLLTSSDPSPTSLFVIDRLLRERLVDAVVVVRAAGLSWKLRQFWRIGRRGGPRGLVRRLRARRLRARLLAEHERRELRDRLWPPDRPAFPAVPDGVPLLRGGGLGSDATLERVRSLRPELGVQAGAGWIRQPLLGVPRLGFLSLHHGMMPAIRGMDSILWAYAENRPDWIGITVQRIDEGLDTGLIVSQRPLSPEPGENPFALIARATVVGAELLCAALRQVRAGQSPSPKAAAASKGAYRTALSEAAVRRVHEMICARQTPGGEPFRREAAGLLGDVG